MSSEPRRSRNGRRVFLALEGEVREALMAGWTVRAIYEEKRERLPISYSQFARHVQRLRRAWKLVAGVREGEFERRGGRVAAKREAVRGEPKETIRSLPMDDFAVRALKAKNLI